MLDGVSLDQLRTFIASADEGSFSAAARKLLRAQSVVSQTVSNLEDQLKVVLFDRSARYPKLTTEGAVLLADARAVITRVDSLKARARGISGGLEPELSVVIDVLFPVPAVTQVAHEFAEMFPATPLRLHIEALGGVAKLVIDERCSIGIIGSLPDVPAELHSEHILAMQMVMVAAPSHPLAKLAGPVSKIDLGFHTQIILTDRTSLSAGREFSVLSPSVWKLSDLGAKHAFLLAGLGWGGMPIAAVQEDLAAGRLVVLPIEDAPPGGMLLPMSAVYRSSAPPGPAGRWFIDTMRACAVRHEAVPRSPRIPERKTDLPDPGFATLQGVRHRVHGVAVDRERVQAAARQSKHKIEGSDRPKCDLSGTDLEHSQIVGK